MAEGNALFMRGTQTLLAPGEAMAIYLERLDPPQPSMERAAIDDALGRVLAQPVIADTDYPGAPRSTMDGFAVASSRTPGRFRIGEGALPIATGGVLPQAADAVVPVEDVRRDGAFVEVGIVAAGACVTAQGEDMRSGTRVLEAGGVLGAAEIGVLATLGVVEVPVFRRPVVAVISSGDELVDASVTPARGQIRDSNRHAIAAALRELGAQPLVLPIVRDETGALSSALQSALERCDAAVVTGGSSVGERDLTAVEIEKLGAPGVIVHGLRVKPGKPTVLAASGRKPIVGLPGNPTSALVILQAVAAPLFARLAGARTAAYDLDAALAAPLRKRLGWTWFVPVTLHRDAACWLATPLTIRSAHASLPARAHGYVTLGEEVEELPAGGAVRVSLFLHGGVR